LGMSSLPLDFMHIELSLFIRSCVHLGFSLMAFGIACLGLSSPVSDYAMIESLMPLHTSMCIGTSLLVYGIA
jgi:hypothetical protein